MFKTFQALAIGLADRMGDENSRMITYPALRHALDTPGIEAVPGKKQLLDVLLAPASEFPERSQGYLDRGPKFAEGVLANRESMQIKLGFSHQQPAQEMIIGDDPAPRIAHPDKLSSAIYQRPSKVSSRTGVGILRDIGEPAGHGFATMIDLSLHQRLTCSQSALKAEITQPLICLSGKAGEDGLSITRLTLGFERFRITSGRLGTALKLIRAMTDTGAEADGLTIAQEAFSGDAAVSRHFNSVRNKRYVAANYALPELLKQFAAQRPGSGMPAP